MIFRPEKAQIYQPNLKIEVPISFVFDWWLAGGAISQSNVKEAITLPTVGQSYAGGAIASGQPWSIVARGVSLSAAAAGSNNSSYIFDSQAGRVILGIATSAAYGFFAGAWANVAIFPDTANHVWFLISDGANVQAYLDNSAVGASQASTNGIATSGATRWRQSYENSGATWENNISHAAVYNIALDSTQRTALYASMTA